MKRREFMSLVVGTGVGMESLLAVGGHPEIHPHLLLDYDPFDRPPDFGIGTANPLPRFRHKWEGWDKFALEGRHCDIVWSTLHDAVVTAPGATLPQRIYFFQEAYSARKPWGLTNMVEDARLPAPQTMLVKEINIVILGGSPEFDCTDLLRGYVYRLVVGSKSYASSALWTLPLADPNHAGSPPDGVNPDNLPAAVRETLLRTQRTTVSVLESEYGIPIPAEQDFYVSLSHESPDPIRKPFVQVPDTDHGGGILTLGVLMSGWLARGIQ